MHYALWLAIFLFPAIALAEYNPETIKQGLIAQKESFQIKSWKLSANGEASIANTSLKGVVLSVGKNNSGMIASLQSSEQAVPAMIRCLMLGTIGMSPKDESQREKIGEVIQAAAQTQGTKSLVLNGVKFEVSPKEVAGNVFLSCILSPANQNK